MLEYSLLCSVLAISSIAGAHAIKKALQERHRTIVSADIVGGTSNFYPVALPEHSTSSNN